jgi:hypothetical protein
MGLPGGDRRRLVLALEAVKDWLDENFPVTLAILVLIVILALLMAGHP